VIANDITLNRTELKMLDYIVHPDCFDPAQVLFAAGERTDGAGDIRRAASVSSGEEELMFGRGEEHDR
jgi:hypothetical protein